VLAAVTSALTLPSAQNLVLAGRQACRLQLLPFCLQLAPLLSAQWRRR
jgi:hypothetical protein